MKLKTIAESIKDRDMFEGFNEEELSEQYPETFSFDELKKIRSYAGKKRYVQTHLGKPLGAGSSRAVYRVDETKVLKFAINQKGLAQNDVEISWGNDSYFEDILAKVYDFDNEESYWVEMELARKVSVNDFRNLWGIEFNELFYYLNNRYSENNPYKRIPKYDVDEKVKEQLENSDEVIQLVDFMIQMDIGPGDFTRKSSWGKVIRDGQEIIVLIDFGLTGDVYSSYYS
jgi:hypothetical protein